MSPAPFTATIKVEGINELDRALSKAPPEIRKGLTRAMRLAAIPARAHADATIHWHRGLTIRARSSGAAVGSPTIEAPIIEFGNKAVIGPGKKVAPHVRKLTRHSALIVAVEAHVQDAKDIAEHELGKVLDDVLARNGVLGG